MSQVINDKELTKIIKEKTGINFTISWLNKPETIIAFSNYSEVLENFDELEKFISGQYLLYQPKIITSPKKPKHNYNIPKYIAELSSHKRKEKTINNIHHSAFAIHFKNENDFVPKTYANLKNGYGTLVVFLDRIF